MRLIPEGVDMPDVHIRCTCEESEGKETTEYEGIGDHDTLMPVTRFLAGLRGSGVRTRDTFVNGLTAEKSDIASGWQGMALTV